jgi:hypothetical protein
MMTSGPAARVGEVVAVDFPRPRTREAVMEHPDYYKLRERLIGFLEGQGHKPPSHAAAATSDAETPVVDAPVAQGVG